MPAPTADRSSIAACKPNAAIGVPKMIVPSRSRGQGRHLTRAVKHGDGDIEQKEKDQERLAAREILRPVLQDTPGGAQDKREDEPGNVERPPGASPGDTEDRQVQHGEVTEQRHVITVTCGSQERRKESADR